MIHMKHVIVRNGKKVAMRAVIALACGILTLSAVGCGTAARSYQAGTYDPLVLSRTAVLPFLNYTPDVNAAEKVRNAVIIDLLSRGIDVVEPGEITRILFDMDVRNVRNLTGSDIQRIGEALGIETVIKGSVSTYGVTKGITISYPEVSIHLSLVDTESSKILWRTWNTEGGPSFWTRRFGAEPKTLDQTVKDVVNKSLNTLY